MLNMFNAQAFLESGKFERSDAVAARTGGVKKGEVTIGRMAGKPAGARPVPYLITDKVRQWRSLPPPFL